MTLNQLYIYLIPATSITTTLYLIYFLVKTKNTNEVFDKNLKELRKKEEDEFDNFVRKTQKEKKEVVDECVSKEIELINKLNQINKDVETNYKKALKDFEDVTKNHKDEIDFLNKEVSRLKGICAGKNKKIAKLEKQLKELN